LVEFMQLIALLWESKLLDGQYKMVPVEIELPGPVLSINSNTEAPTLRMRTKRQTEIEKTQDLIDLI